MNCFVIKTFGGKLMKTRLRRSMFAAAALAPLVVAATATAQQPGPPQFPNMTFFITSTGGPNGANYGGVAGADAHCQALATKAGAGGKTWRAYLSTQAIGGATAENARDRICKGPWFNTAGVQIAASVSKRMPLTLPDFRRLRFCSVMPILWASSRERILRRASITS